MNHKYNQFLIPSPKCFKHFYDTPYSCTNSHIIHPAINLGVQQTTTTTNIFIFIYEIAKLSSSQCSLCAVSLTHFHDAIVKLFDGNRLKFTVAPPLLRRNTQFLRRNIVSPQKYSFTVHANIVSPYKYSFSLETCRFSVEICTSSVEIRTSFAEIQIFSMEQYYFSV